MEANNMAAMRDALEEMATELEELASRDGIRAPAYSSIFSIYAEKCQKALAAPPRNCDVGTAEEQAKRFNAFCGGKNCLECPHFSDSRCELAWAQMPYEEGGAK